LPRATPSGVCESAGITSVTVTAKVPNSILTIDAPSFDIYFLKAKTLQRAAQSPMERAPSCFTNCTNDRCRDSL
jgi:hypothetical protein